MYNNTNIFLILQQFRIIPQHVGKSLIWIEKYFYIWGIIRRKVNPPGDILPLSLLICGIHPHVLAKNRPDSEFHKLKAKLEEYPQAVGIGEIGLDYSTTCRCLHSIIAQHVGRRKSLPSIRLMLQLAKQLGTVIILHVRSISKDNTGKAAKDVLNILRELGLQEAPIHRHCFIGGTEEYKDWNSTLPNCFFSLSSKSVSDSRTIACLKSVGKHDRLLLETDSPYLDEHPYLTYKNGETAAQFMGLPTMELVKLCNRNATRLYNLPW